MNSAMLHFDNLSLNGRDQNNSSAPISQYQARLEAFKKSDADRDALVEEVIHRYEDLYRKYEQLYKDHENERQSRQNWQDKANQIYQAYDYIKRSSDTDPFVMVIMDGDGAIFQDSLYEANGDRGADAAYALQQEIKRHVAEQYPHENTSSWNIALNSFCNLQDLSIKLRTSGLLKSPADLQQFGRAFGLNQPLFNFVDVGAGKERADNKVRENFRLFFRNMQCKHIVFVGISHDAGYRPMLDPYKTDENARSKISLLETYPSHHVYHDLGFTVFQTPTIFRSRPLIDMPPPISTTYAQPAQMPAISATASPVLQRQPTMPTPSPAPSSDSWASIGKPSVSNGSAKTIDITPAAKKPGKYVFLNQYEERLDPPLPKPDPTASTRFYNRHKAQKVCNNYHLLGDCAQGRYCDYDHGEKLTPGETLALRYQVRNRCCPLGSDCRDVDCVWGHMCPWGDKCKYGMDCHFYDIHDVERKPRWRVDQDNNYEKVGPA